MSITKLLPKESKFKIRNLRRMESAMETIIDCLNELRPYTNNLQHMIDTCEIALLDIDHITEMMNISAVQSMKVSKARKNILKQRREVKNELQIIQSIPDGDWNAFYRIAKLIKGLCENFDNRGKFYSIRCTNVDRLDIDQTDDVYAVLSSGIIERSAG